MSEKRAKFTAMEHGTAEDWSIVAESNINEASELPNKIIDHLMMLGNDYGGFAVDRLTHSIQTATRAYHDGRDEEYVVCALLHDIGDDLAPMNHSQYAASIIRPYVSEKTYWIILHHGLFQTYYSAHHLGGDRNARDKFRNHKYYQDTVDFCEKYDQSSFDPNYKSMSLKEFEPMVKKIFDRKPFYHH